MKAVRGVVRAAEVAAELGDRTLQALLARAVVTRMSAELAERNDRPGIELRLIDVLIPALVGGGVRRTLTGLSLVSAVVLTIAPFWRHVADRGMRVGRIVLFESRPVGPNAFPLATGRGPLRSVPSGLASLSTVHNLCRHVS